MKRVTAFAILCAATALALSGLASAKQDPASSGLGTPVFVIGSDACPGFVAPRPQSPNVGWTITGTVTPIPPIDPNNLLQPFQSDRTITLAGSFTDSSGEVWDVSGTLQDTSIYFGTPGSNQLVFSGFGEVKFKGDRGDHLYGQANVRFVTGPGELDFYFTPAAPFPFIQSDGPVGISNCHIKAGV